MLVDSHCHLCHPDYEHDWRQVLQRADKAGVGFVINIATDVASSQRALAQTEEWEKSTWRGEGARGPRMAVTVGLHPNDADQWDGGSGDVFRGTTAQLRYLTTHRAVVAIGEIGLDFYWTRVKPKETPSPQNQEDVLRALLRLAQENFLPVVIHSRDSVPQLVQIIQEEGCESLPGVFHCFAGTVDEARTVLDLDFHVGLTGNVTFPRSDNIRELAKFIPLDRLLIETDSPYLAPQAFRGKRNEPAHVQFVAEAIAETRGISVGQVGAATTDNACELFGLR